MLTTEERLHNLEAVVCGLLKRIDFLETQSTKLLAICGALETLATTPVDDGDWWKNGDGESRNA